MGEAKDLVTKSFSGNCNSFCIVSFDNQNLRTDIVKNSTSPHWNGVFSFEIFHNCPDKTVLITVLEKGALFRETPIGTVKVPLNYFQKTLEVEGWFGLENSK